MVDARLGQGDGVCRKVDGEPPECDAPGVGVVDHVCAAAVGARMADAADVDNVATAVLQRKRTHVGMNGRMRQVAQKARVNDFAALHLPCRGVMRVPAEEDALRTREETDDRGLDREDVVPRRRIREVAVNERHVALHVKIRTIPQPLELFFGKLSALLDVDPVVAVAGNLVLRLQPKAGGIVVAHQYDVEILANDLKRALHVIAVSRNVAKQHEASAPATAGVGNGRLKSGGVRARITHYCIYHSTRPAASAEQLWVTKPHSGY